MLPAFIIILVVTIYPLCYSFWMSFQNYSIARPWQNTGFIGLKNYERLLSDSSFWKSLDVTFRYAAISLCIEIALGLLLALALNREFKGRGILRSIIITPMVLTPVAIGLIWKHMYNDRFGVINYFLSFLGIPRQAPLANVSQALLAVIVVDVWQWTPFVMLLFLMGLQAIPEEIYEAAQTDGVSNVQTFRHITLPLLRSTTLLVLLLRTMDVLKTFDTIFVMTRGGPGSATQVYTIYNYIVAFSMIDTSYSMALSLVLLAVVTIICTVYIRVASGIARRR